jgi:hypothetical protein
MRSQLSQPLENRNNALSAWASCFATVTQRSTTLSEADIGGQKQRYIVGGVGEIGCGLYISAGSGGPNRKYIEGHAGMIQELDVIMT